MQEPWRSQDYNCVLDRYLWFRKSAVTEPLLSKCRKELEVQSKKANFITGKPQSSFRLYKEGEQDDDWFGVPPFYRLAGLPEPQLKLCAKGLPISVNFGGDFQNWRTDYDQKAATDTVFNALQRLGGTLLCVDTGMGKTLISLYLISALKRKTLVIVHKKDSIVQWTKQAGKFLPDAKVGVMRASIRRTQDMDIVLTTVQSLSKGKYSRELLSEFGFVIADEIHLMAAEEFHKAFTHIQSEFRLGLTATPERRDGLSVVIEHFVGVPSVTIHQPRNDVLVRLLHYQAGMQTPMYIGSSSRPNYAGMISRLVKDKWRNQLIGKEAIERAQETTGQTLVISERKAHVEGLANVISNNVFRLQFGKDHYCAFAKAFEKIFPSTIINSIASLLRKDKLNVAFMTGDGSEQQRQIAKTADIVCATLQLAKESLDMPNLTRLIIATPVSKNILQQLRGRLLRTTEAETKARGQNLILSHCCDDWESPGMFTGMFWGCCNYFKSEGYVIKHFYYNVDEMEKLFPVK